VTGGCAARREDGISKIRIRYAALALDFTWYNFVRIHRSEVDALTEVPYLTDRWLDAAARAQVE